MNFGKYKNCNYLHIFAVKVGHLRILLTYMMNVKKVTCNAQTTIHDEVKITVSL